MAVKIMTIDPRAVIPGRVAGAWRTPMLSKLYIVLTFAIACLLVGCRSNVEHWEDNERIVPIVDIDGVSGAFNIYCDRSTNMAYLFYIAGQRSAITAYLNADGNPARCSEVHR